MTYMVALGLGVTATIRVGNEKGRKDLVTLKRVAISNFLLVFLISFFFALFFIVSFMIWLPWLYLDGNSSAISSDVITVVKIASDLILIAAFFQIADGTGSSFRGFEGNSRCDYSSYSYLFILWSYWFSNFLLFRVKNRFVYLRNLVRPFDRVNTFCTIIASKISVSFPKIKFLN